MPYWSAKLGQQHAHAIFIHEEYKFEHNFFIKRSNVICISMFKEIFVWYSLWIFFFLQSTSAKWHDKHHYKHLQVKVLYFDSKSARSQVQFILMFLKLSLSMHYMSHTFATSNYSNPKKFTPQYKFMAAIWEFHQYSFL